MPLTVAIVEDDRATRESLALLIDGTAGLCCQAIYTDAETALRSVPDHPPDILLVDLHLPGLSGIECVRRLRPQLPALKMLVLTKYEDADHIFQALKAGAHGYLLKQTPAPELLRSIVEVRQGSAPLSSEVAARMVSYFHEQGEHAAAAGRLSPRESEILDRLAKGYLYPEIAHELDITYTTVNGHIKSIYEKLHVHSRAAAVAKYLGA
ncbi:MAG: response regulator transcription factor [Verrucomicrobia bacterium]|nr:response regulator transcription factor [Verrucomicrobiota bacterium]